MGLLDYLTKDPEQQAALMQGLLGGAFGAMAGRGSRLQAWGQGGLTGLQSYTGARESQAQAKRVGLQDQFLQMQMQDRERARADEDARRKAVQGAMIQPTMPSTMDARDIGQPGEQQLTHTFDLSKYAQNLAQIGSPDAIGAFQALQPKPADYKVVGNSLVQVGLNGVREAYRQPEPKDKGTGDMQEFAFASARGEIPPGMSFTEWLRGNKKAGASKIDVNTGEKIPEKLVKTQDEMIDRLVSARSIDADLGGIEGRINAGDLKFGPVSNLVNAGRNAAGISSPESRNFASFKSTLEKLRNDSLRLNSGVQTEGDAQRAWGELFQNINDEALVKQRLTEIRKINQRAAKLHEYRLDVLRRNSGAGPLEIPPIPAAIDSGAPKEVDFGSLK